MPKILIAEDELALQRALQTKLQSAGYIVWVADNGQQAIDITRDKKPDLILLDIMMPIKDGFEVLDELKADANTGDIPIIFLTNLGQEFMKEQAKFGGACDYFVKTDISLADVLLKVNAVLGISHQPAI